MLEVHEVDSERLRRRIALDLSFCQLLCDYLL
jgi:hypothetical protein